MSRICLIRVVDGVKKDFGSNHEVSRVPCPGEQLEIKVDEKLLSFTVNQVRHIANPAPNDAVAYVVLGDLAESTF